MVSLAVGLVIAAPGHAVDTKYDKRCGFITLEGKRHPVLVKRGGCKGAKTLLKRYIRRADRRDCGIDSATCPTKVSGFECRLINPGEEDIYGGTVKCEKYRGSKKLVVLGWALDG